MRKRKFVAGNECRKLLEFAAEKPLPLTITQRGPDNQWKVYKSTILKLYPYRMEIALPVAEGDHPGMEAIAGQEIAITFKKGYNKCLFTSRIISQDEFEFPSGEKAASLTIYVPEQVEKIQRRAFERTNVPGDMNVEVHFWSIDDAGEQHAGVLENLSTGGIGVAVDSNHLPGWPDDQLCQVQFTPLPGQESVIAQGRYRHSTHLDADSNLVGFQFVGLELTEEGRNIMRRLGRVVNVYQRQNQTATKFSHKTH